MRTTKQDLLGMFKRLSLAMNKTTLRLDHAACYGGYTIVDVEGGHNHILGHARLPAKEMYQALNMVCNALELERFK